MFGLHTLAHDLCDLLMKASSDPPDVAHSWTWLFRSFAVQRCAGLRTLVHGLCGLLVRAAHIVGLYIGQRERLIVHLAVHIAHAVHVCQDLRARQLPFMNTWP